MLAADISWISVTLAHNFCTVSVKMINIPVVCGLEENFEFSIPSVKNTNNSTYFFASNNKNKLEKQAVLKAASMVELVIGTSNNFSAILHINLGLINCIEQNCHLWTFWCFHGFHCSIIDVVYWWHCFCVDIVIWVL